MSLKTDELIAQGLTQEQVNYVMAEYGKEVNPLKAENTQLKEQLNTARATLKSFEGVDVTDLKNQVSKLTKDLESKETEMQQKLADRDFNDALKEAILASGARSVKAVIPFLDSDTLKSSKNQKEDIQKAVAAVKKDNDYLFKPEKPVPKMVASTPGINQAVEDKKTQANEALRSLFGKE